MLKSKESLEVEYLGGEKLQISEYENKMCNFYLIKKVSDKGEDYSIESNDYFITKESRRMRGHRSISYDKCEIVVFEDDLIINEEKFKAIKKNKIDEAIKEDFLYSLALYYIKNENIESGQEIIAQIGDIYIYNLLEKDFNIEEKIKVMNILTLCIDERSNRFKEGKLKIKANSKNEEAECLIQILNEIMEDKESKLLWDYSYDYKRTTQKNYMIEDNYIFIRPKIGYGEIKDIVIGSKKLNIFAKVKIDGEVKNKENKLKLDSYIFREYTLVLNGKLNMGVMWCKLSNKLKAKYKKRKLIKSINNVFGEEIITLDLTKLDITNNKMLRLLDAECIAEYLWKIEELKIRQGIISNIIKDRYKNDKVNKNKYIVYGTSEIIKKYRVDQKGLYHPIGVEKNNVSSDFQIYLAKVFEWKVEKYPKKKVELDIAEDYRSLFNDNEEDSMEIMWNEYKRLKVEQKEIENKVNIVRISSAILNKKIFIWEKEIEKEKKETDKFLDINTVVGGKIKISIKKINDISIRQDSYSLITRCE